MVTRLDVGSDNDLVVIAKVLDTDVDEVMDVLSYYFSELSLLRIGERLSMSREKVRIIIRTTLRRLKPKLLVDNVQRHDYIS